MNGVPPGFLPPPPAKKAALLSPAARTALHSSHAAPLSGVQRVLAPAHALAGGSAAADWPLLQVGTERRVEESEAEEGSEQEEVAGSVPPPLSASPWASLQLCSNAACGRRETSPDEFRCCSSCREARYCSRHCQAMDWCAGHRVACAMLTAALASMERQRAGERRV